MADRTKNTDIFRKESLDRVSSPDDLDRYIRSTTPSLWLLLGAVIFMLVGFIIWASIGKVETVRTTGAKAENGELMIYIREVDCEDIAEDAYLEIDGVRYTEATAVDGPFLSSEKCDPFLAASVNMSDGEWYYTACYKTDLPDGEYKAKAVLETISPIKFIIN